jgi:tetratricopeptide (TPR) repeat protein
MKNDDWGESRYRLAMELRKAERYNDAIRIMIELVNEFPDVGVFRWQLGYTYLDSRELEAAIEEFEGSIRQDSRCWPALSGLGRIYGELLNWELAEHFFRESLAVKPRAPVFSYLSSALMRQGKYEASLKECSIAIGSGLESTDLYLWQGLCYKMLRQYHLAEESFRASLALDPDHALPLNELALSLINQGRFPEARACLKRSLSIDSTNYYVRLYVYIYYNALNRTDGGRRAANYLRKHFGVTDLEDLDALKHIC